MANPTKNDKTKLKKAAALVVYEKTYGNITDTCQIIQVNRSTFYEWLRKDIDFKNKIEEIQPDEIFVDFAESHLHKRIEAGDTTAIIFALKTKGKKRGYVEKSEIEAKITGLTVNVAKLETAKLINKLSDKLAGI